MRRHLSAALCLCAPLWTALVGACSPGDFPSDGSLETSSDAIINGVEDTTHQAVVAYLHGAKCSATIIAVDGNIGYALTAAHCIDNTAGVLRQGNNHNSGYIEYPVIDRMPHPEYVNAGLFDFAMLKFSGATAATPVIAPLPAAQDNLTSGKQLTLVGYGLTQNGNTSVRHSIKRHLNYATALRLNFSQMTGGMCSGDSGGAALYTVGGSEYVAGVHAFVSGDCTTSGTSVRVSAVLDTFIMPYINGGSSKPQNCAQCSDAHIFDGGCTDHVTTCLNNNDCNAYVNCLQGCNSAGCNVTCGNDHAAGKVLYDAVYSCVCTGPCSNECVDDVQCAPPASCGLTSSDSKCQTCLEASCCAEASSCSDDGACVDCLAAPAISEACAANPPFTSLNTCLSSNCADACDLPSGGGAGGAGGGEGGEGGAVAAGVGGGGVTSGGGRLPNEDGAGPGDEGCGCRLTGTGRGGASGRFMLLLALFGLGGYRRRSGRSRRVE